jgi:hypothetical protein
MIYLNKPYRKNGRSDISESRLVFFQIGKKTLDIEAIMLSEKRAPIEAEGVLDARQKEEMREAVDDLIDNTTVASEEDNRAMEIARHLLDDATATTEEEADILNQLIGGYYDWPRFYREYRAYLNESKQFVPRTIIDKERLDTYAFIIDQVVDLEGLDPALAEQEKELFSDEFDELDSIAQRLEELEENYDETDAAIVSEYATKKEAFKRVHDSLSKRYAEVEERIVRAKNAIEFTKKKEQTLRTFNHSVGLDLHVGKVLDNVRFVLENDDLVAVNETLEVMNVYYTPQEILLSADDYNLANTKALEGEHILHFELKVTAEDGSTKMVMLDHQAFTGMLQHEVTTESGISKPALEQRVALSVSTDIHPGQKFEYWEGASSFGQVQIISIDEAAGTITLDKEVLVHKYFNADNLPQDLSAGDEAKYANRKKTLTYAEFLKWQQLHESAEEMSLDQLRESVKTMPSEVQANLNLFGRDQEASAIDLNDPIQIQADEYIRFPIQKADFKIKAVENNKITLQAGRQTRDFTPSLFLTFVRQHGGAVKITEADSKFTSSSFSLPRINTSTVGGAVASLANGAKSIAGKGLNIGGQIVTAPIKGAAATGSLIKATPGAMVDGAKWVGGKGVATYELGKAGVVLPFTVAGKTAEVLTYPGKILADTLPDVEFYSLLDVWKVLKKIFDETKSNRDSASEKRAAELGLKSGLYKEKFQAQKDSENKKLVEEEKTRLETWDLPDVRKRMYTNFNLTREEYKACLLILAENGALNTDDEGFRRGLNAQAAKFKGAKISTRVSLGEDQDSEIQLNKVMEGLWGAGTYASIKNTNSSKVSSLISDYLQEAEAVNNNSKGRLAGAMHDMLVDFQKDGVEPEPGKYAAFLSRAIENGYIGVNERVYYLMAGIAIEVNGSSLLSRDTFDGIVGKYFNSTLPVLYWFKKCKPDGKPLTTTKIKEVFSEFDFFYNKEESSAGKRFNAEAVNDFIQQRMFSHKKHVDRANDSLRQTENYDKDDYIQTFAYATAESLKGSVLFHRGGKPFQESGLRATFGGFTDRFIELQRRALYETPEEKDYWELADVPELLVEAMKGFHIYSASMLGNAYHDREDALRVDGTKKYEGHTLNQRTAGIYGFMAPVVRDYLNRGLMEFEDLDTEQALALLFGPAKGKEAKIKQTAVVNAFSSQLSKAFQADNKGQTMMEHLRNYTGWTTGRPNVGAYIPTPVNNNQNQLPIAA